MSITRTGKQKDDGKEAEKRKEKKEKESYTFKKHIREHCFINTYIYLYLSYTHTDTHTHTHTQLEGSIPKMIIAVILRG